MGSPSEVKKNLRSFHGLPRSSFWSHLHRHARAEQGRRDLSEAQVQSFILLAAFRGHWWKWASDYFTNRFGRPHPYRDYKSAGSDTGVYPMPDEEGVVIDLAGDWGTGTDEAEAVGKLMRADHPQFTVHLGDIYYVGAIEETRENFLGLPGPSTRFAPCAWPLGTRGSFALLGNHEMYSRAKSYFEDMLPALGPMQDGRPTGQKASFFCLENKHWQIVGLDTGYNSQGAPILEYVRSGDCALRPELIEWLKERVLKNKDDRRGLILLSHHQYYSRFDEWVVKPAQQLTELINRPVLWFWGHEHRLAVYKPFSVEGSLLAYGRCIGHGGMPVDLVPDAAKHPECELEFVDDRAYPNDEGLKVGYNGYVRLRLEAGRLRADYIDLTAKIVFSEAWTVEGGELRRLDLAPALTIA